MLSVVIATTCAVLPPTYAFVGSRGGRHPWMRLGVLATLVGIVLYVPSRLFFEREDIGFVGFNLVGEFISVVGALGFVHLSLVFAILWTEFIGWFWRLKGAEA